MTERGAPLDPTADGVSKGATRSIRTTYDLSTRPTGGVSWSRPAMDSTVGNGADWGGDGAHYVGGTAGVRPRGAEPVTAPVSGDRPPRPPLRARWIAFKTFRHRLEATGDVVDGYPVYSAGPSRLVLQPGAHHFRQLRPCAFCGKEMTGRPVVQAAGLARSGDPHMCQDCSTGAAGTL